MFRILGLGFGFRAGLRFRVQGIGFKVSGEVANYNRIQGLGYGVSA